MSKFLWVLKKYKKAEKRKNYDSGGSLTKIPAIFVMVISLSFMLTWILLIYSFSLWTFANKNV